MRLPYRPKLLPVARARFQYIMIHDVTCQYEGIMELIKDSPKFQVGKMRANSFILDGMYELNYHFVVDKINDNYESIMGRPLYARCEIDGLPTNYNDRSIHIGAVGDFHNENPGERFYQEMAYRIIIPMMRIYHISPAQVMLHRDVVEDSNCPGTYFKMALLQSYIKSWKVTN